MPDYKPNSLAVKTPWLESGAQGRDARKNQQCAEAGIQFLRVSDRTYEADPPCTIAKILNWLSDVNSLSTGI